MKTRLIKYGTTLGVCFAFVVFYLWGLDWAAMDTRAILRNLSDAFSVPGLLCVFSGLFIWLSNEGTLDGVGFVLSHAFHLIIPGSALKHENYGEYLERKRGKKPMGFGFLLISGAICLVISGVLLMLFHQV